VEAHAIAAVDPPALTARIKAEARRLGFDKVGVAPAAHADPKRRLRAWLDRGFAGEMSYLDRTAADREDPDRVVPGARSVIALMLSYYSGTDDEENRGPRIARYARGADYHRVLVRKVRKLRRAILALAPNAEVHPAVDTSPVLERAWAERAGIGWVGKSCMAIAPELGTYTFLATLITTLELVPDAPHEDRCGSCTACLDACPTGAFVGPGQLDARRCITYWNVEHQGPFDATTTPLHGWLAGCDVCQEVCPWNKFKKATREPRFLPRPVLLTPRAEAFADPDPAFVEAAIQGTALQRTGPEAMRRNALRILEEG
jgi:epoxyqueuosine reductase